MADQVGYGTAALLPIFDLIETHVFAAERLFGDDTTIPIQAKDKCTTGRIWTYVCDDRPYGGAAAPAAIAGIFLDVGQFKKFAPRVRMAKGEGDRYRFLFGDTERLEAIVTITLQNAAIRGQVLLRVLAAAVARRIVSIH